MRARAISGETSTLFWKQSTASDFLPSFSSAFPFCRLACLRLEGEGEGGVERRGGGGGGGSGEERRGRGEWRGEGWGREVVELTGKTALLSSSEYYCDSLSPPFLCGCLEW